MCHVSECETSLTTLLNYYFRSVARTSATVTTKSNCEKIGLLPEKKIGNQNKINSNLQLFIPTKLSVSDTLVCTHTPLHTHRKTERDRERECVCVCVCVCWQRHVFARHVGPTRQLIHSRLEDGQMAIKVFCVSQCEGDVTICTAS